MKNLNSMSVEELLDALEYHRSLADIRDELIDRREAAGFESLGKYLQPRASSLGEQLSHPGTLAKELDEIATSGWDFTGMINQEDARAFCQDDRNRLVSEKDLTLQAQRFLFAMRRHYQAWKQRRRPTAVA